MEYRKDIQGLRAIAVLSVWLFHLNEKLIPGGFIGVDIFFVISGFLISSIILHQKEKNTFSLKNFYTNRIKRIIPAYYVFLLIISLLVFFIYIPFDYKDYIAKLFHSFTFICNFYFARTSSYFGPTLGENPLLHTWTLAVEMQFYFFLPFILIFLSKKKSLILTISLFTLFLIYAQYYIIMGYKDLMYFSLFSRVPEFLVGVILSLLNGLNGGSLVKNKNIQSILGISGIILIFVSFFIISEDSVFPGLFALMPCLGAILILSSKDSIINKFLSNRTLVYIGKLSYSIYLWHWGILALMKYYNISNDLTTVQYIAAIAATLVLSVVSYYLIENKFRKLSLKQFLIKFSLIPVLLIIFMMSFWFSSSLQQTDKFPPRLMNYNIFGVENHAQYIEDVVYGNPKAKDSVLLIGNSHALVMKKFISEAGKKYNFYFRSVTNNSTPTIPGIPRSEFRNSSNYDVYKSLCDTVKSKLQNANIIIIASTYYNKSLESHYIAALDSLNSLLNPNQHIIVLSDFLILSDNPAADRIVLRRTKSILKSKATQTDFNTYSVQPSEDILHYISQNKNMHYLDMTDSPIFKEAPFYNDTLTYYDKYHLNEYGSLIYEKFSGHKLGGLIDSIRALK